MFKVNWQKNDMEIRTTENLDGFPYVELIKWNTDDNGRRYCYTLAFFRRDSDGYYSLVFVGDRPFTDIAEIDIQDVWKELFLTQMMLESGTKEE